MIKAVMNGMQTTIPPECGVLPPVDSALELLGLVEPEDTSVRNGSMKSTRVEFPAVELRVSVNGP